MKSTNNQNETAARNEALAACAAPADFFPVVQQALLDAFGLESFLMEPPYHNFDRFDRGIRKMLWGTYSTTGPIFSISGSNPYSIIVLESTLGFYNIAITLDERKEPALGCILPFRTERISQTALARIIRKNSIPPQHILGLQQFYGSLPVAELSTIVSFLQHLITAFLPAFSDSHIEYVDYRSEQHTVEYSEERTNSFRSDYAEEFKKRLLSCTQAITAGDPGRAVDKMRELCIYTFLSDGIGTQKMRQQLLEINASLCMKLLDTAVHPVYVLRQQQLFSVKIQETDTEKELLHLPLEMARKYAILVRNYAYDRYSYLIRNVVNYIEQHLSEELTLAILAEEFGKNPSYLSNAFRKEVGDTLTVYISKQRIQMSLRYFNTTSLSVAEVAVAVGIPDFGYFSKQFKKYVGTSPREYKKMLDK